MFLHTQKKDDNIPLKKIDTDYIADLGLLTNASARVKSLLYRLEQGTGGIGL